MNVRIYTEDALLLNIEISPDTSKDSPAYYFNAPGTSGYTTQTISMPFHDIFTIWNAWSKMSDADRCWYESENSKYDIVVLCDGIRIKGGDWGRMISKQSIIDVYYAARMIQMYKVKTSSFV